MVDRQFNYAQHVLPAVERLARHCFRSERQAAEMVLDAVSLAWEGFQTAPPEATVASIAFFAVQGVRHGRQFSRSERSIDCPRRQRREEIERAHVGPEQFARVGDDPAEVAMVTVDFASWAAALPAKQREVLLAVLQGETTNDLVELLGVSAGRISQMRRQLLESWAQFTA